MVCWSEYLQFCFKGCNKRLSVTALLGYMGAIATSSQNPAFAQSSDILSENTLDSEISTIVSPDPNFLIAQSSPPPGVTIPPTIRERVEETIPKPTKPLVPIPSTLSPSPAPPLLQSPPRQATPPPSPTSLRFYVKKIEVLGNTVLKDEINKLVKEYENQEVTFEDLLTLRSRIVELYREDGYVTSGAFVPDNQVLDSGTVQIQVVEAELERIEINGLTRLQKGYVLRRLGNATKPPLNSQRLEEKLQLLLNDPLIKPNSVNAELTPGSKPGYNILRVDLQEAPAFHAGTIVDNYQSPSIGSIQGRVFANHDNLFGFGDRLTAEYGRTDGLNLYDLGYTLPLLGRNGTFNLRYDNNDSNIVEAA